MGLDNETFMPDTVLSTFRQFSFFAQKCIDQSLQKRYKIMKIHGFFYIFILLVFTFVRRRMSHAKRGVFFPARLMLPRAICVQVVGLIPYPLKNKIFASSICY